MKSFLDTVTDEIIKKHQDFRDLEIIVPNNRLALYINEYLKNKVSSVSIAPNIRTISSLFEDFSGLYIPDDLYLLIKLYKVYNDINETNVTFEEFQSWGQTILNDFDDIEKYLVDAEKLFSNIRDISEIDKKFNFISPEEKEILQRFWKHILEADDSDLKQKFLDLWSILYNLYVHFNEELLSEGIAYQGLAYKVAVNKLSDEHFPKSKYLAIGFNALNKCEIELFKFIGTKLVFYWDADKYYLSKVQNHEAGMFLKKYIYNFSEQSSKIGITDTISNPEFEVEVIGMPSSVSLVNQAGLILNEWRKKEDFIPEKTAIILADESLLIPLMSAIPSDIDSYNISMGYPLRMTSAFTFLSYLLDLRLTVKNRQSKNYFYGTKVINILNHPYIKKLCVSETEKIKQNIITNNQIYVESESLFFDEFTSLIFTNLPDKVPQINKWLLEVINFIFDKFFEIPDSEIELQFIFKIQSTLNLFFSLLKEFEDIFTDKREYFKLLLSYLRNQTIAFEGQPIEGVQVMGFIETRCIDFDRIIMLSVNEGVFPKTGSAQSIIPYNLRKAYEMPVIEFQDSIYAYYFYRLLQRAKEVKVLYSSFAGDNATEPSRFISQLKYEVFTEKESKIKFTNLGFRININSSGRVVVKKDENIIEKYRSKLTSGISPSEINTYLDCRLKHYFSYILGIKEPKTTIESIEPNDFGSIFHQVMKTLYEPFKEKLVNKNDLEALIKSTELIKSIIKEQIIEYYKLQEIDFVESFKNILLVEVVARYVKNLLEFDSNHTPFVLLSIEEELSWKFKLTNDFELNIKGKIDRIDFYNNVVRIIDYKTGDADNKFSSILSLFEVNRSYKAGIATQLMIYSIIYKNKNPEKTVTTCIYELKKINNVREVEELLFVKGKDTVNDFTMEMQTELIKCLENIVREMLDVNLEIIQTENENNCKFCIFKNICNK